LIGMIFFRVVGFGRYRGSSYGGGRGGDGRGKGEGGGAGAIIIAIIIVALALMIIGYIGVLFSRLIQAAVSRQREYLADAAAVQFTRNPDGIANALKKIGGTRFGSKLHAAHTMEMSHLFFANGIASSLSNVFSTHPPLVKRICAIDPS